MVGRAFMKHSPCLPPLRGGIEGGVNPRANASTPIIFIAASPHPRSLPAGEGGTFMKRSIAFLNPNQERRKPWN